MEDWDIEARIETAEAVAADKAAELEGRIEFIESVLVQVGVTRDVIRDRVLMDGYPSVPEAYRERIGEYQ